MAATVLRFARIAALLAAFVAVCNALPSLPRVGVRATTQATSEPATAVEAVPNDLSTLTGSMSFSTPPAPTMPTNVTFTFSNSANFQAQSFLSFPLPTGWSFYQNEMAAVVLCTTLNGVNMTFSTQSPKALSTEGVAISSTSFKAVFSDSNVNNVTFTCPNLHPAPYSAALSVNAAVYLGDVTTSTAVTLAFPASGALTGPFSIMPVMKIPNAVTEVVFSIANVPGNYASGSIEFGALPADFHIPNTTTCSGVAPGSTFTYTFGSYVEGVFIVNYSGASVANPNFVFKCVGLRLPSKGYKAYDYVEAKIKKGDVIAVYNQHGTWPTVDIIRSLPTVSFQTTGTTGETGGFTLEFSTLPIFIESGSTIEIDSPRSGVTFNLGEGAVPQFNCTVNNAPAANVTAGSGEVNFIRIETSQSLSQSMSTVKISCPSSLRMPATVAAESSTTARVKIHNAGALLTVASFNPAVPPVQTPRIKLRATFSTNQLNTSSTMTLNLQELTSVFGLNSGDYIYIETPKQGLLFKPSANSKCQYVPLTPPAQDGPGPAGPAGPAGPKAEAAPATPVQMVDIATIAQASDPKHGLIITFSGAFNVSSAATITCTEITSPAVAFTSTPAKVEVYTSQNALRSSSDAGIVYPGFGVTTGGDTYAKIILSNTQAGAEDAVDVSAVVVPTTVPFTTADMAIIYLPDSFITQETTSCSFKRGATVTALTPSAVGANATVEGFIAIGVKTETNFTASNEGLKITCTGAVILPAFPAPPTEGPFFVIVNAVSGAGIFEAVTKLPGITGGPKPFPLVSQKITFNTQAKLTSAQVTTFKNSIANLVGVPAENVVIVSQNVRAAERFVVAEVSHHRVQEDGFQLLADTVLEVSYTVQPTPTVPADEMFMKVNNADMSATLGGLNVPVLDAAQAQEAELDSTCGDSTKNNAETDVDCGGSTCQACALDKACTSDTDCQSGHCKNYKCANVSGATFAHASAAFVIALVSAFALLF